MSDYTPTTAEVRASYCFESADADSTWQRDGGSEFDRWLAAERARVWDEGAVAVINWAEEPPGVGVWGNSHTEPTNPYKETP